MARFKRIDENTGGEGKDVPQKTLQGIRETSLVDSDGKQAGTPESPIRTDTDRDFYSEVLSRMDKILLHLEAITGEDFKDEE